MAPRSPACPVCRAQEQVTLLSLEGFPVWCNRLCHTQSEARQAARAAITLKYCRRCGHIFNAAFDPSLMAYTPDYENSLHFSPRFQQYAEDLARQWIERYGLRRKHLVEIGCGQGDFLSLLCRLGGNRGFGFDPSCTPTPPGASVEGVTLIRDLYSERYAHYPSDFILSRQVLEHLAAPCEFVHSLRRAVDSRQPVVLGFEVPNALYTLRNLGIWDIIYEHPSYFTPLSLRSTFEAAGFRVLRLEPTFGDQFLIIEAVAGEPSPESRELERAQLESLVAAFAEHYQQKVAAWREQLAQMAARGQRAVVWGAGSKGVTFLNTFDAYPAVEYVVDINPRKLGRYVAGSGQAIIPPAALRAYQPDVVIIMNANYREEISAALRELDVRAEILLA